MPLDNAQFIAELDPLSPAGTDPLNQGDDHIRQTKLATQQSFPNVGSAVPQTGVQMAQMAIKNEINTFTQNNLFATTQTFQLNVNIDQTTAATRSLQWRDAGGNNIFQWQLTASGAILRLRRFDPPGTFQDNAIQVATADGIFKFANATQFSAGTTAAPGIAFELTPGHGFSRLSSTIMVASAGGSERMRWQTADATLFTLALAAGTDGSAAVPSYSWFSQRTAGFYRAAANIFAFSIGSTPAIAWEPGSFSVYQSAASTAGAGQRWLNAGGIIAYEWQYEGTAGFQPGQFSLSRFNRTTGAFIDIPLYINATTGRVHTALPVLSP